MSIRYDRVRLSALGKALGPDVVTSAHIEARLKPAFDKLRIPPGQIEALTGIRERRMWPAGTPVSDGAIAAAKDALQNTPVTAADLGSLVFCGVNRDQYEPATACRVADALGMRGDALVYDLSNACLGVLNGMLEVANRIQLGQIRAGLVVSSETSRAINDQMIARLNSAPSMALFASSFATFTGGSGGVAVLLTDGSFGDAARPALLGGVALAEPAHFDLCWWGVEAAPGPNGVKPAPVNAGGLPQPTRPGLSEWAGPYVGPARQHMRTDAPSVLKHGVALGKNTYAAFLRTLEWTPGHIDKTVCHQVGSGHRKEILGTLELQAQNDFITYPTLGNMGTVSLPLSLSMAEDAGFIQAGDRVALMGIGSGLNCMMLGLQY